MQNDEKSVSQSGTRPKYRYRRPPGNRSRLWLWTHARLMRANVAAAIGEKEQAAELRASLVDALYARSVPV